MEPLDMLGMRQRGSLPTEDALLTVAVCAAESGKKAGLNVICTIHEPTAAALAYAKEQGSGLTSDDKLFIFDLGGGTFDITIFKVNEITESKTVLEVIGTGGERELGGDDFDNKLMDYIMQWYKNKHKIDINDISNLKVEPLADVHKLLLQADVVCGGINSLVVLEAAVAGKPIVLPCFKEYKESKFFDRFFYRNHLHLFDVADDAEDYGQKIFNRINDGRIDPKIQKEREQFFAEYCLPLCGTAKESCSKTIRSVIREYRSLRKEK